MVYKGQSVNEREDNRVFVSRMNDQVKGWSHSQMNAYIDSTIQGFTEGQVGHMAWYLGSKHEQMLREKEATMHQGDNMEDSNGDDKYWGVKD